MQQITNLNKEKTMDNIGIITEETADFTPELIKEHQIATVPISLHWPEVQQIQGQNIFQKMRQLEKRGIESFGKTAQASPGEYLSRYLEQINRFKKVICITISSRLSGSYNTAILAKKLLPEKEQEKVFVVDSLNGSGGQALVALKAIDLIKTGKAIQDVVRELTEVIPYVHLFVMCRDIKWGEASGRVSHVAANILRGMARLGIAPLLACEKGAFAPAGLKIRAKDAVDVLFRQLEEDTRKIRAAGGRVRVAITHGDNLQNALRLKEKAENELNNVKVVLTNIINDVIGAPAGPDVLTMAWCRE
jgi:DegV family protein with EDD domain